MDAAAWGLGTAVFWPRSWRWSRPLTIVMAMGMTRSWRSSLAGVAAALVRPGRVHRSGRLRAGHLAARGRAAARDRRAAPDLRASVAAQGRPEVLRPQSHARRGPRSTPRRSSRPRRPARSDRGPRLVLVRRQLQGCLPRGRRGRVHRDHLRPERGQHAGRHRSAALGCLLVMVVGIAAQASAVEGPENTLKYGVGLLLAPFGTFWAVEGLGILQAGRQSLEWPGADLSIIALVLAWFALVPGSCRRACVPPRPTCHTRAASSLARHEEAEYGIHPRLRSVLVRLPDRRRLEDRRRCRDHAHFGAVVLLSFAPPDRVFTPLLGVGLMVAFVIALGIDTRKK